MAEPKEGVDKEKKNLDTNVAKIFLKVQNQYATRHIVAAALFARLSGDIEKADVPPGFSYVVSDQYKAFVSASVFSAFAFLEATINEFFGGGMYKTLSGDALDATTLEIKSRLWKIDVFRSSPIFEKFQSALDIAKKEKFDRSSSLGQNFDDLKALRNALLHFVPEWFPIGDDIEISNKLEKRLKGKFPLSPGSEKVTNPFFPDKCMSYGCAKWAVESSLEFADEFFRRMDLECPYERARSRLQT